MSDSIVIEESNGEIIVIEPTVVINQTTCAAEWGGITGDIGDQSDLITLFNTKENKNRTILESDNFDEVTANGKYSANYGTIMLDVANAHGQVFQRAVYQSTNEEKFRWQIGGEWNDWITLTDTDMLNTKVDKVDGKGLSTNDFTNEDVSTLQTHDDDITELQSRIYTAEQNKVDKIPGKSLSTNDYTTAEKTKLAAAVTSSTIATIVTLTQAAYDALNPKVTTTLYIITGA